MPKLRRHLGLALLALSIASVACGKRGASGDGVATSASAAPSSAPRPVPTVSSTSTASDAPSDAAPPERVKAGCRALSVTGTASIDGQPITTSALLDGEHWVELAAGSSVALRHTQTSREFKLIGPGHALPCRGGSEQILLADGQLSTSASLGVRPGAEVLIATPEGVVRYGDAALDVEFGSKGLRVRVKQGEAWVEPEERGKPRFENPVRSGAEARLSRSRATPRALVDVCESTARAAEASARRVLLGEGAGGSDSLGARAAVHMRERAKARTACAIAAAATFGERDPAIRQRLSASVAHADAVWQSVPRARP